MYLGPSNNWSLHQNKSSKHQIHTQPWYLKTFSRDRYRYRNLLSRLNGSIEKEKVAQLFNKLGLSYVNLNSVYLCYPLSGPKNFEKWLKMTPKLEVLMQDVLFDSHLLKGPYHLNWFLKCERFTLPENISSLASFTTWLIKPKMSD